MYIWLVEIRLKQWVNSKDSSRVVTYEEVIANDEYGARHAGFDQFEKKAKYSPILKRKLLMLGVLVIDCYAPDAVILEKV